MGGGARVFLGSAPPPPPHPRFPSQTVRLSLSQGDLPDSVG